MLFALCLRLDQMISLTANVCMEINLNFDADKTVFTNIFINEKAIQLLSIKLQQHGINLHKSLVIVNENGCLLHVHRSVNRPFHFDSNDSSLENVQSLCLHIFKSIFTLPWRRHTKQNTDRCMQPIVVGFLYHRPKPFA